MYTISVELMYNFEKNLIMKNFQEIRDFYLSKSLSFFDSFIEKEMIPGVPHSEYLRIPVYTGNCVAILMIWGINGGTAIHGHGGIEGTVIVLKGIVKEEKFRFSGTDVELVSSKIHVPGDVLEEDQETIHSLFNRDETWSVTLHIYNTNLNSLSGTIMYDAENKRVGILNDLAKTTSWKEDPKSFRAIIPFNQYFQEKMSVPHII
jgi:cysteine dioxygenase